MNTETLEQQVKAAVSATERLLKRLADTLDAADAAMRSSNELTAVVLTEKARVDALEERIEELEWR